MSTPLRPREHIASLLWLVPALVFSVAILHAPAHSRAPEPPPDVTPSSTDAGIGPATARMVFDVLLAASASEEACTFDGATTESIRIDARWHHAGVALPPAVLVRAWNDAAGTGRLVASVPPELRNACPRTAAALDAIGDHVTVGSVLEAAEIGPVGHSPATMRLARARWVWIAIAAALALVTRWVALALARVDGASRSNE